MNNKLLPTHLSLCVVAASFLLSACGNRADPAATPPANVASAPASARSAGAPISVTTVLAKQRNFDVSLDAIGTVTPQSSVDVKPQINSVVTRVHVKEGQFVKAGELLFTLDARPDVANVAKVRAQMVKDQAVLDDAQRQLARSRDLLAKNFISQGSLDTAQAQVDSQMATLVADRAALDSAQLALSYNSVRASGAGRLGAVNVFPGTAVQANMTALGTITQLNPINISFNLPQSNLNAVLEGLKSGGAAVNATLPDTKNALKGRLQFVDNLVDPATGTIKVKASFDNPDSRLWPGAFVKVTLTAQTLQDAVVIPTAAIIQSTRGSVVYTVDKGAAALRPVLVVASQDQDSAVTGIAAGSKVVLEGRQNLRPDALVVERLPSPANRVRASASAAP